jgi:spore germination cell wall hydrolase CwlJ-like protein
MYKRPLLWVCVALFYFFTSAALAGCASTGRIGNLADRDGGEKDVAPIERTLTAEDRREIQCLAENVYHEARGEPVRGQLAVALVTRNRVGEPNRPNTICGVVWQRSQFSWTNDGRSDRITDQETFEAIYDRMYDFYVNNPVDFTGGANYYHANYVRPRWSRVFRQTAEIGAHIFYRG